MRLALIHPVDAPPKLLVFFAAQTLAIVGVGGVVLGQALTPPTVVVRAAPVEKKPPEQAPPKVEAAAPSGEHHPAPPRTMDELHDVETVLHSLLTGNQRFVSGKTDTHDFAAERKVLVKGQHPKAMVLSCADSRVPPELLFDQSLGDLFVVRTAGNVADRIALASLEYGAEHLKSHVLVVLGHEKCGAVTAATKGGKMPTKNLEALMDDIAPSLQGLKGKFEGDALVHEGVAANVEATANEVLDRSPVLKELWEKGELTVVRAVYALDTGEVRVLEEPPATVAHHP